MRVVLAFIALATFTSGCGGSSGSGASTSGLDGGTDGGTLGQDYAGSFAGTWYSTFPGSTVTFGGVVTPIPSGTALPITATATNQLSLAGLCQSGAAVTATVTGPNAFSIAFDCPAQTGTCQAGGTTTLTESLQGSGQLSQAGPTLTFTMSGVVSECGQTPSILVAFTGSKTQTKK